ncbi:hypothetical protein BH11BAC6_BH11BAC6_04360 [soil metagenome]
MKKALTAVVLFALLSSATYSQTATSTIPVSIGLPCGSGGGITDSIMYFTYDATTATMKRLSACRPTLASPGISAFNTGVSYNPADGYLYFQRFASEGTYIWRWKPDTCPGGTVPVYQFYANKMILGLDFDANGMGYQIIFTGNNAPYGLALQKVDFSTGTLGTEEPIDLQGQQIMTQNGDMVITSGNQMLMVWDNLYFTLNYQDYGTGNPLVATYISTIAMGGAKLVGLSYAQGKLVSSGSNCGYYDFNILSGNVTDLTEYSGLQWSTDMTNITSGIGAAKELVSSTPISSGVYDLVYDIRVDNFGDYPVSNFQITEDLTTIHSSGGSVISNVTTQWVENPAGLTLNASFNGKTNKNLISVSPAQQLPNYPVSNNYCIIRVKFRMSSVVSGIVYNNNAVATGTGYSGVLLKDSSTNGHDADLKANFKPDDNGENQPTPFSVSVSAETPPCTSINTILYNQSFGTGTGVSTVLPGTVTTQYIAGTNPMDEETYLLSNDAYNGNNTKYVNLTDHTGNTNGRMMIVNADVNNYKLFEDAVTIPCANLKYTLIVNAANIMNDTYNTFCDAFGGTVQPKLAFIIRNAANNKILANGSTGDITERSWNAFGMKFVMPAGVTSIKIQIYNTGEGGCGNAVAIDDIQFGICDPLPYVATALPSAGCLGSTSTFNTSLSDTSGMSSYLQYQWQSYTDAASGWVNISNANTTDYSISPVTSTSDQQYYRIIVSASGNSGNSACQYTSNAVKLTIKDTSTSPIIVKSNRLFACPGSPITLTASGATFGTNAIMKWYEANCAGTFLGSGDTMHVILQSTTSYFVNVAGDCNTTQCAFVVVPQLCILAGESVNLRGTINGQYANLAFTILTDQKVKSYLVERSTNGVDFTTIRKEDINAYADKNGYTLKDNLSTTRENNFYYRIKIIADNSEAIYSKVIKLSRNSNDYTTIVSPNPATTSARVTFSASEVSKVEIKLFNMQGQLVRTNSIMSVIGANDFYINNLDKLPAGIYNISITNAEKTTHAKVVIQR